jgi:hypothetical protein
MVRRKYRHLADLHDSIVVGQGCRSAGLFPGALALADGFAHQFAGGTKPESDSNPDIEVGTKRMTEMVRVRATWGETQKQGRL